MKQSFRFRCLTLALLAVLPATPTRDLAQNLPSVWVARRGKWVSGPPVAHGLRFATGTILFFKADGSFAMIEATINKNSSGTAISQGDGYVVYSGTWSEEGSKIRVHYRLLYKTLKLPGENVPGPYMNQVGSVVQTGKQQTLELSGRRFSPDPTIQTSELNQIVSSSHGLTKTR